MRKGACPSLCDRMHRVAITGLGCVSALGLDAASFWAALMAGRPAIGPLKTLPTESLNVRIGAEVRDYDPACYFDPKQLTLLDRFAQFAVLAAREAVRDAGLSLAGSRATETAVVLGSGAGGKTSDDEAFFRLYGNREPRVHPTVIPRVMVSSAVSQVTIDLGIRGPAFAVSSACASASHAIGQAFWMVRHGMVRAALAGGSEASFTVGMMKAWESLRVLAPDTCRPFSLNRRGMVLGEGAGVVVLEPLEDARSRGAEIYAELAGFGMSADADHMVQPSAAGAAAAMQAALKDAELPPSRVCYINAHGTGTPSNDATESEAIHRVFGRHAEQLAVSSTKSMHGHALGASGALELAATLLAMRHSRVPPTANFQEPDPRCNLDCVPNVSRPMEVSAALSNSFAFGGLNAVLALRKPLP